MKRAWLQATVLWGLISTSACASDLTLVAMPSGGPPLTVAAGESSPVLAISVVNRDVSVVPADFLTGWQLALAIVPQQGSFGSVSFASASAPTADYVFSGTSSLGPAVINNGDDLVAFDTQFPFTGGVQVPDGSGAGLLDLVFRPTDDAYGRFGLFAQSSRGSTEWTDAAQPVLSRRDYENIPADSGLVSIAEVFVSNAAVERQVRGDYDRDGDVDLADYDAWNRRYGEGGSPIDLFADGNLDGLVDAADYSVWRDNFDPNRSALSIAVPEPMSFAMVGLSGLGVGPRTRLQASSRPE